MPSSSTSLEAGPPEDPDDWTDEQWCDWLQAFEEEPDEARPLRRRRSGGSVLGAAMLGLEPFVTGRVNDPEVAIEIEADGQDDGLVVLDPDDPASSVITIGPT